MKYFLNHKLSDPTLALASLRGGSAIVAMPFIDDELLWSPDNDGRMVDLQACLQTESNQTASQTAELANGGCDLNTLDDPLDNDSDELLRQLTENSFELEQFFQDFPATEIKVEENNNDLQLEDETNGQIFLQNCSQFLTSAAAAAQLSALSVSETNDLDGGGLPRLCSGGNDQLVGSSGLTTQQLQEQAVFFKPVGTFDLLVVDRTEPPPNVGSFVVCDIYGAASAVALSGYGFVTGDLTRLSNRTARKYHVRRWYAALECYGRLLVKSFEPDLMNTKNEI
uniref:Uncharacterized protein n=1 Tax=Anopheles farauti TaxID=69004 RepID=A0A182Q653_9DIPT